MLREMLTKGCMMIILSKYFVYKEAFVAMRDHSKGYEAREVKSKVLHSDDNDMDYMKQK